MGNALGQAVILDAGAGNDGLEGRVAVLAQGHQLGHVALEGCVVALGQELQAPLPLGRVKLGPEFERAFGVEHPFQRLERRFAVGPGLAVAHRNLCRIAKAGFQRGIGLPVHQCDFMSALQQMPGRADPDDACAQNCDPHGVTPEKQTENKVISTSCGV